MYLRYSNHLFHVLSYDEDTDKEYGNRVLKQYDDEEEPNGDGSDDDDIVPTELPFDDEDIEETVTAPPESEIPAIAQTYGCKNHQNKILKPGNGKIHTHTHKRIYIILD